MVGVGEEAEFEIGIVVPKKSSNDEDSSVDSVEVLVEELRKAGLVIERVQGLSDDFIKVAAPLETLGRVAAEIPLKKRTKIGMDLSFEWEEFDAFVRQPDGSLFSWSERFRCYRHLIYGISNGGKSSILMRSQCKDFFWNVGESLLMKLETEGIVKQVFPLHIETTRKWLLRNWALNWWDLTEQPINEIQSYFGTKIATYFAFLGMYTRWMIFPAVLGTVVQLVDFGFLQLLVLPFFFIFVTLWAIIFFQFWKRKNSALLARWQLGSVVELDAGAKLLEIEGDPVQMPVDFLRTGTDIMKVKQKFQRNEWFGFLLRFRNDAIIILSIICLQLPFELAYAHLYDVVESDIAKFGLTAVYLVAINYFTQMGGRISVRLIKKENNRCSEYQANSLVYKVFGLYFMQSYIGIFYHALLHRNLKTLRQVLIQRLLLSEVLENLVENSVPYIKYSYKKYKAVRYKRKHDKDSGKIRFTSRVEREYLKPAYVASIGKELEDGLFDDLLELALQFGMIMMFACAFPLAFTFSLLNNVTEIRTDALKLLVMLKRPIPRAAATIGAWLNIFQACYVWGRPKLPLVWKLQFLMVMSICTNCVLLVCLYDEEGKWRVEPGLAAILVMEHVLLLIKFGFSRFVPEEPAWVRANRLKNATQAQDVCSKQLLRSISGEKRFLSVIKKTE